MQRKAFEMVSKQALKYVFTLNLFTSIVQRDFNFIINKNKWKTCDK